MPDISEDSAIFGIITAFPGCNPDFMLGFEAGMVWGQLWSSKNPVKIIVQKANLEGITKLAEHFECRIKVEDQESDSLVLTLTKTPGNLGHGRPSSVPAYRDGRGSLCLTERNISCG